MVIYLYDVYSSRQNQSFQFHIDATSFPYLTTLRASKVYFDAHLYSSMYLYADQWSHTVWRQLTHCHISGCNLRKRTLHSLQHSLIYQQVMATGLDNGQAHYTGDSRKQERILSLQDTLMILAGIQCIRYNHRMKHKVRIHFNRCTLTRKKAMYSTYLSRSPTWAAKTYHPCFAVLLEQCQTPFKFLYQD